MSKTKTQQTRFSFQIRSIGLKRLILSLDFLVTLALLITLILNFTILEDRLFKKIDDPSLLALAGIASTIFTILIATLAIILSFSSSKFIEFLSKTKKLEAILFSFWLASATFLLVILLVLVALIFKTQAASWANNSISIAIITLFTYALLQTFYVLATVLRFAYFIQEYESKLK